MPINTVVTFSYKWTQFYIVIAVAKVVRCEKFF